MASQQDRIAVQLSGTTEGTIQGGRFIFDPDTIRQVIKNYKDLAESYRQATMDAEPMARVGPPADEFVSQSFAKKANASGESYLAYCDHYARFYLGEAQKCQDALDAYLGAEERTVIELGKVSGDSSQPAL